MHRQLRGGGTSGSPLGVLQLLTAVCRPAAISGGSNCGYSRRSDRECAARVEGQPGPVGRMAGVPRVPIGGRSSHRSRIDGAARRCRDARPVEDARAPPPRRSGRHTSRRRGRRSARPAEIVRDQQERMPSSLLQLAQRSRICAWIVTSSAVVGSSAIRSFGLAGERDRDHHALAHAAGELVWVRRRARAPDSGCRPVLNSSRRARGLPAAVRPRAPGAPRPPAPPMVRPG